MRSLSCGKDHKIFPVNGRLESEQNHLYSLYAYGEVNKTLRHSDVGWRERVLAGGGAAVVSAIIFNPLDVIKTRLQAQAGGAALPHHNMQFCEDCIDMLDGMFSFVLVDTRENSFLVARDAIGITLLYTGWGLDGSIWFGSEMKALNDDCERFECFPPGYLYSSKARGYRRWYNPPWFSEDIPTVPYNPSVLRQAFENVRYCIFYII